MEEVHTNLIKQLKDEIKAYRKSLDDNDEIASDYAKNIVKMLGFI